MNLVLPVLRLIDSYKDPWIFRVYAWIEWKRERKRGTYLELRRRDSCKLRYGFGAKARLRASKLAGLKLGRYSLDVAPQLPSEYYNISSTPCTPSSLSTLLSSSNPTPSLPTFMSLYYTSCTHSHPPVRASNIVNLCDCVRFTCCAPRFCICLSFKGELNTPNIFTCANRMYSRHKTWVTLGLEFRDFEKLPSISRLPTWTGNREMIGKLIPWPLFFIPFY